MDDGAPVGSGVGGVQREHVHGHALRAIELVSHAAGRMVLQKVGSGLLLAGPTRLKRVWQLMGAAVGDWVVRTGVIVIVVTGVDVIVGMGVVDAVVVVGMTGSGIGHAPHANGQRATMVPCKTPQSPIAAVARQLYDCCSTI